MALEILLPKLGLTMTEGMIEEWVVSPGARVSVGDIILRLATDKVDVDVEAEGEGTFHPHALAGATLAPGAVTGWLLAEGEDPPAAPSDGGSSDSLDDEAPAATSTLLGGQAGVQAPGGRLFSSPNARRVAAELGIDIRTVAGTGPGGRIVSEDVEAASVGRVGQAATPAAPSAAVAAPPAANAAAPAPPSFSSPLVRKLAKEAGVDLTNIQGTGVGGRIRRDDVHAAAAAQASSPPTTAAPAFGPGSVIPLTGIRGAIAKNMMASLSSMAQLTLGREVDISSLASVRAQLKADYADLGLRAPTITDFIVKAAALALRQHPLLNATIRDDQVVLLEPVNIGLAVSIEGGLVVPVLNDADIRSLADLAQQSAGLADTARSGRLSLPALEGATFAVTSLGTAGIDFFTPVISPGNVGILGVGRIKDAVRWDGEVPCRTQVLTLSLTFDHRAVDGAPAAEFLATVADLLGRPLVLLAG